MISVEGASLLAQVIPVALLVLAFEARNAESVIATTASTRRLATAARFLQLLTVTAAVPTEIDCVMAVSSDTALSGATAVRVFVVTYVLAFVVGAVLLLATVTRTGIADMLHNAGKRNSKTRERLYSAIWEEHEANKAEEAEEIKRMAAWAVREGHLPDPSQASATEAHEPTAARRTSVIRPVRPKNRPSRGHRRASR